METRAAAGALIEKLPLISCVLVAENRPEFVLQSIRYFQRQDYPECELVIVDDEGADLAPQLPEDPRIRYLRLPPGLTAAQKLDYGCQQSRGGVLALWDDSDWHAAERLSFQIGPILTECADAVALSTPEFIDLTTGLHWSCSADALFRIFQHGVNPRTLMLRTEAWRRLRECIGGGFEWMGGDEVRLSRLPNENMYVAMARPGDNPGGHGWKVTLQPIVAASDLEFLKRPDEVALSRAPAAEIAAARWKSLLSETQDALKKFLGEENYYTQVYSRYEEGYWANIPAWLEEFGKRAKPSRVLDIGAAWGSLAAFCSRLFECRVECIDLIAYMTGEVASAYGLMAHCPMNIETDRLPPGTFDAILLTEALEHFNFHPVPTLRKIGNALSSGGRLFLSTPDAASWGRVTQYYASLADIPAPPDRHPENWINAHIWQYTREELMRVIEEAGFIVEKEAMSSNDALTHFNLELRKS